jgi:hypothetical protein
MNKVKNFGMLSVFFLGLALVGSGIAGCGDDDPIETTKKSYIRVTHLSPDAPGVDVFVNGETRVIQDLGFSESTGYLEVDEGTYSFNVSAAGSSAMDSVLDIENITLSGDKYYTAVAYDALGSIKALALEDDFTGLDNDKIRVRAIHTASGVGQVDIWNIPTTGDPSPLYENVDFGVVGDSFDLPAGAYTLGFDIDNDATPDVIFKLPALSGGTFANVFAVSDSDGNVFLNAQFRDGSTARIDAETVEPGKAGIRVIHLSPDAPAVDIWVNDSIEAVSDLSFPDGTGYLELDEGTYDFDVAPAGTSASDSVLAIEDLSLMADMKYTAVAYDSVGSIKALALVDDESGLASGNIRVRAIHTAVGIAQVDIWNIPEMGNPSILYENVDFGAVGGYLDLPAGAYTLGFDLDNDATPDVIFQLPSLTAGTIANVFAVTDSDGNAFLNAQLQNGTVVRIDPTDIEPGSANIRVIHLSPDAPAVDIWVNDSIEAVSDLLFGVGTGYIELEEGTYDFDVSPAGTSAADSVLAIDGLELMADRSYTAVAYDSLGSIKALALEDDYSNLDAGNIRVRAIHTAVGVGQVDIWNIPEMGDPSPLYENVDFGVVGGYLDLPAGAYTLGFDVDDDASPDAIFSIPALSAGTVANVFAVTDADGNLSLRAQLNNGDIAQIDPAVSRVRVLHLSPDAPAVDVLVNEIMTAVVSNLGFEEGTGYLEVLPGEYNFHITPAGGTIDDTVLHLHGLMLEDGKSYTAVAFDFVSDIQGIWLEDDYEMLDSGNIRVRAIHAAASVGQVDIWNIPETGDPSPLYENVDFGVAGNYLDLPAGAYTLGFDVNDDATPDVIFELPALSAGTVANVFAVNDSGGTVFLQAQFADGTLARIDAM